MTIQNSCVCLVDLSCLIVWHNFVTLDSLSIIICITSVKGLASDSILVLDLGIPPLFVAFQCFLISCIWPTFLTLTDITTQNGLCFCMSGTFAKSE